MSNQISLALLDRASYAYHFKREIGRVYTANERQQLMKLHALNYIFCLYRDFPFDQLVFLYQDCNNIDVLKRNNSRLINTEFSCTYLRINKSVKYLLDMYHENTLENENLWAF